MLDPQAGPFGFTTNRVKFHEQISHSIHAAFFRCVESIFSSWPCSPNGWTREFPTLMIEKIKRFVHTFLLFCGLEHIIIIFFMPPDANIS